MKRILLLTLVAIFIATSSYSQNSADFFKVMPVIDENTPEWAKLMYSENPNVGKVEDMYNSYYRTNEFVKTTHTQNYKHWVRIVEPLLDQDGYIKIPTREEEDLKTQKLKSEYLKRGTLKSATAGVATEWTALGPFETFKKNTTQAISWHKNIYSIDRSLSNSNLLICGTESGGIYKTVDKAANWTLISKDAVFSGTNAAVKIHPTNESNYLVASNNRIYQTLDGGTTWLERHNTGGEGNEFKYSPSDPLIIFHTSTGGLFKSIDGGATWTQVYTDKCWDLDFHPTNNSIAYLLKTNPTAKRAELFKSTDGGATWSIRSSGWYTPSDLAEAADYGGKIAVTTAAAGNVFVCLIGNSKAGDGGWIGVYKSTDIGETWVNAAGHDGAPYGPINGTAPWNVAAYSSGTQQGFFNFDFEASPINASKFWVGTIRLSESDDGCATFKSIGASDGTRLDDIHADIQDIEVLGNEVWVASDGGVNYSTDELTTHVALNRGIQAAEFWGFGTGWNEDTYTGGKYHDGTTGYSATYGNGRAYNIGGVEEPSGYVHPIESRKLLFREHYSSPNVGVKTIPLAFGDALIDHPSYPVRPNESYGTAERSGVYFDPRYANHIYVGFENKVLKSTDGGANFKVVYSFPDATGLIYEMEISRSNPNVIYGVYNSAGGYFDKCEIWKSTDAGKTWSKTSTNPTGNNYRFRISVHPENENIVWICDGRGANGERVYSTADGGATWTNRTTPILDGKSVMDILYQGGSSDVVYIACNEGVYFWNGSDWSDFSLGLPFVAKSLQINPFYKDGQLRLASRGRGVWARELQDLAFNPVAQPITYNDTVLCSRDVVQFDCYSILNHSGASWEWTITPAPQFISSTTVRNPTVVFGADGSYSVTLKVTDGNAKTSTKTIPNMVTVKSACEPEEVPGLALNCKSTNSYVNTPDLNVIQTNTFTISAWVKPNGTQPDYSGIVFSDESNGSGLNFRPGNQLGFHWNNDKWFWGSGLTVPSGKWSHVALVVTPTSATVYLNGVAATNTYTVPKVDFHTMKIGSYHGWATRNYNGEIDEVCIWKKSLTQNEIRELMHLTRTGTTPFTADLLTYYQFNLLNNSAIMDKVGSLHGTLAGDAEKIASTAPVGGGNSERQTISTNGIKTFTTEGIELNFGAGTLPDGEICVTRLNLQPDSLPVGAIAANVAAKYWIINNYGTNSSFTALTSATVTGFGNISAGEAATPEIFKLHKRNTGDFIPSAWNSPITASSATSGVEGNIVFNTPATGFNTQFTIVKDVPSNFEITASAGTNGTITPSGAVNVTSGADQTFTIAANAGYSIQDVLVDGASVGAVPTYTFPNVMATHTITASFTGSSTVWTGATSTDWNTASNWNPATVPDANTSVVITDVANDPVVNEGPGTPAVCKDLTITSGNLQIAAGKALTVNGVFTNNAPLGLKILSDNTGTGSLIANSVTGTGTAEVQRYMAGNQWHMASPPAVQSIATLLSGNSNISTSGISRGMMDFNTTGNNWTAFYTNSKVGNLEAGKGYSIRTDANGGVTFTGQIHAGALNYAVTNAGSGWNLIGNPFTSAIAINSGAENFFAANSANFDPSFAGLYFWDEVVSATQYQVVNLSPPIDYATLAQAFFVKSNANTNMIFTPAMQVHQPTVVLKDGTLESGLKLIATASEKSISTTVKFIEGTTDGLDIGYDAGILKRDPSYALFTRLVEDNGVDFTLQCLPLVGQSVKAIPVGLNFTAGGGVTFTSESMGIPADFNVILEDRLKNKFVTFDNPNVEYATVVDANSASTGRFFLYVTNDASSITSSSDVMSGEKIQAYLFRKEIIINGKVSQNAVAHLFDMQGRAILVRNLEKGNVNKIGVNGLKTGVYLLQIIDNGKQTGIKIPVKQ